MTGRQRVVAVVALALHLFVVFAVSLLDFSITLTEASNGLPASVRGLLKSMSAGASLVLGKGLAEVNPWRQAIATYADCAGIEAGYSYFAPSVPGNSKLEFELFYPDGRVEYDVPTVGGEAAGYRMSTLLDHLHAVHYSRLREGLVMTLASASHREHPDAVFVRAIFGVAQLPSLAEYKAGKRITYQTLYTYDFRPRPYPKTETKG